MFNDILTGKASLDPKPEPTTPYREPGAVPPVTLACVVCKQAYEAPAGSVPGRCPTCYVAMAEANAKRDADARRAMAEQAERTTRSHRILGTIVAVALAVFGSLFWRGMQKQQREDAAQAAGFPSYSEYERERDAIYPTDRYSSRIHDIANEMCQCENLACARDVLAKQRFALGNGDASDDMARKSVEHDLERSADCQAHFEGK